MQRTTPGTSGSVGKRWDKMGRGGGNESMVVASGVGQGQRRTADNSRQRQWSVVGQRKEEMGRSGVDLVYDKMWWRNKRNYVGGWLILEWLYGLRRAKLCALWTVQAFICAKAFRRFCADFAHFNFFVGIHICFAETKIAESEFPVQSHL